MGHPTMQENDTAKLTPTQLSILGKVKQAKGKMKTVFSLYSFGRFPFFINSRRYRLIHSL